MIRSFEVGAVFKIINKASPPLTAILRQVRALNEAVEKARANIAELGKASTLPAKSMDGAIAQTRELAAQWKNVAKSAGEARLAIGSATSHSGVSAAVAAATGGGHHGRGGGRGLFHFRGAGAPLPGGGHISMGGAAGAAAGVLGYGAYQAAELQDAVWQMTYTAGLQQNAANHARFRQIIKDAMVRSGFGLKDISSAAKQEIRMFQGTNTGGVGAGIDVLPEMLRAATIEARLKGSSVGEAMTSLIGLAHMTRQYSPSAIKKLAPAFAFLSTANPGSLQSIERAAGYAVPILQSGLDIDPLQTLLLGTALTRAGATASKSGTWLRELVMKAMPGTSLQSKVAFKKHEHALQTLGLVDASGKPTWFTNGRPDVMKMLELAGQNAPKLPLTERAAIERQIFGARGSGAFSLLTDPKVLAQVETLGKEMNSTAFKNRYSGFMSAYSAGSTAQQARQALQQFNTTLMQLGANVLPGVNLALKDFTLILRGLKAILPGGSRSGTATVIGRATEGAAIGGGMGFFAAGVGAVPGAAMGAVVGGAEGVAELYMKQPAIRAGHAIVNAGHSFAATVEHAADAIGHAVARHLNSILPGEPATSGPRTAAHPISLQLNVDGRTLAQAISYQLADLYGFPTGAAIGNGASRWNSGELGT